MEPFDGGIFDRPVHSFDLTVCPRVPWFCEAMIDIVPGTNQIERVAAKRFLTSAHLPDFGYGPPIAFGVGEMSTVISEYGVDFVRNSINQMQ
jgi:hypothetical protein